MELHMKRHLPEQVQTTVAKEKIVVLRALANLAPA